MVNPETAGTVLPLLESRGLRVLLVAAPGVMAAVAVFTASLETGLGWMLLYNAAAGVIISSALFVAVSFAARRVADDRVTLAKAAQEGHWQARAKLVSIRNEETGLYTDWYFRLRLHEEIDRSKRYQLNFSVLVGRPTFVHNELDARATSGLFYDRVGHLLRRTDLAAVLKDGSLAVLLPHTKDGAPVQRRLAKALAAFDLDIGAASYPDHGEDADGLLATATRNSPLGFARPASQAQRRPAPA